MNSKLLYLLTFMFLIFSLSVSGETAGNRIIDKKEIEASGITQLSEIFTLIPEWHTSSIDGVTWNVSPNGLEPYSYQRWKIILDDVLLDAEYWGTKPLDMIPINISQIDYIEVINIPGIYSGEFIESGALHFHTIDNNKKTTLKIEGNLANEIGDPGPYRYTEHTSPNVDRLAENIGVVFDKRINNNSLSINFKNSVHFPTDPAVRQRNTDAIDGGFPKQNLLAAGFKSNIGKLKLLGGMTSFEDIHNFFTLPAPQGLIKTYNFINTSYPINISNSIKITAKMNISRNAIKDFHNKLMIFRDQIVKSSIRIDHIRTKYRIGSEIDYKFQKHIIQLRYNPTVYYSNNINLFKTRLYFDYNLSNKITNSISFEYYKNHGPMFSTSPNRYNIKVIEKIKVKINNQHTLQLGYFMGIRYSDDINYYSPRIINDELHISPLIHILKNANVQYYLDWEFNLTKSLNGYLKYIYSYYDSYYNYKRTSSPDGKIFSSQFYLNYKNSNNLAVNFFYSLSLSKGDSQRFNDQRKENPKHTLQLSMTYEPYKNLSFWGKIKYTSSTFWIDQDTTINEMLIADVSIRKKLMKNKAAITFGLRNILNDTQRYHPSGAAFDLNYFVRFYIDVI
ncbi:MAG: hypothetical protein U9N54_09040 [candidate division Zixibacteria bacterium]|nr:hypothetical protein [candidate division Zixibacteria bacterium]